MPTSGNQRVAESRFAEKLSYFLRYYEASNLACGLIAARCESDGDPEWAGLQQYIQDRDPRQAAQVFYDDESKVLFLLLDGTTLADTHYLSLQVKERLQERHRLQGSVYIASFPESGDSFEALYQEVIRRLEQKAGAADSLQFVVCQPSVRPHRLLLIENDPVVRQLLAVRFARSGYDVHTAIDGAEGMEKYLQLRPDLVITELTLPVMNGFQVIDWLREQQEPEARCKIVVLTDKRLEEDMTKCFQKGVADYITKPFSPIELDWRIKRLLVS